MKHWKPGYSAYETAHVWLKEDGFPKEIRDLFKVSSCGKWNNPPTPGKTARLEYQKKMLGLIGEHPTTIRYQLLHRTASAVIEAGRFNARYAVMIVHSFSQTDEGFPTMRSS